VLESRYRVQELMVQSAASQPTHVAGATAEFGPSAGKRFIVCGCDCAWCQLEATRESNGKMGSESERQVKNTGADRVGAGAN